MSCPQSIPFMYPKLHLNIVDFKENINKLKETQVEELQIEANSLVELHRLNFIDDQYFYTEFKKITDQLEIWNDDQVAIDNNLIIVEDLKPKEEKEKENSKKLLKEKNEEPPVENINKAWNKSEIDKLITHLQCQLLASKSDNLLSIQKLKQDINFTAIKEQEEYIQLQKEFIINTVKPYKVIHENLCEECGRLEKKHGFKKKRGNYSHHKKNNIWKRKVKRNWVEVCADEIWGEPNNYLKDTPYMSDKSEDIDFEEIEKCKTDLKKFKEKIKLKAKNKESSLSSLDMKEEIDIKEEVLPEKKEEKKKKEDGLKKLKDLIKEEILDDSIKPKKEEGSSNILTPIKDK